MQNAVRKLLLLLPTLVLFLFFVPNASANTTATLLPINDGTYTQWTPKSGTVHYTEVNETTCNGNTTYNHTSTTSDRDSYGINISSIPDGSTITQIAITPCASKNSGGSGTPVLNIFYILNGSQSADDGSYSLSGTTPVVLSTTNYTGLNTIVSPSSTFQIGAVLTSGATRGARLSQINTVITYTPLSAPSDLTATPLATESVQLQWTNNATNATNIDVERSKDDVNFTQIATVSASTTSYIDPNEIGTFYYRVRAFNSGGDSSYSNTATVTVPLNSPTNLTAVASDSAALLNWVNNSINAQGFYIERSTDSANYTQIASVSALTTSYTDSNLPIGTYYYRVRAFYNLITSLYSNVASVSAQ